MIEYRDNQTLDPIEVARVFQASGISRLTKDIPRIAQMLANANIVISAWDGGPLDACEVQRHAQALAMIK